MESILRDLISENNRKPIPDLSKAIINELDDLLRKISYDTGLNNVTYLVIMSSITKIIDDYYNEKISKLPLKEFRIAKEGIDAERRELIKDYEAYINFHNKL